MKSESNIDPNSRQAAGSQGTTYDALAKSTLDNNLWAPSKLGSVTCIEPDSRCPWNFAAKEIGSTSNLLMT